MKSPEIVPIETLHLFSILDELLIDLLESLTEEEWNAKTVCKKWNVKDIASHLLDGNLRALSTSRDSFFGEKPEKINSYSDLVAFLDQLNMTWTNATKRLSPAVLIDLLKTTGKQYSDHLYTLKPFENAIFSVAWAGQETSLNWFHIAREYTEKFLHQQQIRDTIGKQALLTQTLFFPFISICMKALPHVYKNVKAQEGTIISILVTSNIGGQWNIIRQNENWEFITTSHKEPSAIVKINPNDAWLLFSKAITPSQAKERVEIIGDKELGEIALNMVSVMA